MKNYDNNITKRNITVTYFPNTSNILERKEECHYEDGTIAISLYKNDKNGNMIYQEEPSGFWIKWKFDENNNKIYAEDSNGYWCKYKYNDDNLKTFFENSFGYWSKREYDEYGNQIYYESSDGNWKKTEYDANGNLINEIIGKFQKSADK